MSTAARPTTCRPCTCLSDPCRGLCCTAVASSTCSSSPRSSACSSSDSAPHSNNSSRLPRRHRRWHAGPPRLGKNSHHRRPPLLWRSCRCRHHLSHQPASSTMGSPRPAGEPLPSSYNTFATTLSKSPWWRGPGTFGTVILLWDVRRRCVRRGSGTCPVCVILLRGTGGTDT